MSAKYDKIGKQYDATRRSDLYLAGRLVTLLKPEPSNRYLDLACGTGNYTTALANAGVNITGVDQSRRMITRAHAKTPSINWCLGDAGALPFADASFDGATCTLAIHHFPDLIAAFTELRRVLRQGRFVLFTSARDQMRGYWLNEYFPTAMENSIRQMPDLPDVEAALSHTGFKVITREPYAVRPDLQDLFLYSGKFQPRRYLDPHIRAGISSFTLATDPTEIDRGCARLAHDIETGAIDDVRQRYEHDQGDYLFVVSESTDAQ